jgi:hypothetical protein
MNKENEAEHKTEAELDAARALHSLRRFLFFLQVVANRVSVLAGVMLSSAIRTTALKLFVYGVNAVSALTLNEPSAFRFTNSLFLS